MPARLRLYSDLICPFCFVAERSSLVRLVEEFELPVEWIGYELHPGTPRGGVPLAQVFPQAGAMLGYVKGFAEGFGIDDLRPPAHLASTRRALAAAEHARDQGRLEPFRALAFDAYWRRGWGIEEDEDLRWLAREVGLDPEAAVQAAAEPALLARVDQARAQALAAGVRGVPTFDFVADGADDPVRVVGCQRYENLAEAARKVGAGRRR
ncbi:MAG: DsbA family protein [Anaeromyxobacter sp.]